MAKITLKTTKGDIEKPILFQQNHIAVHTGICKGLREYLISHIPTGYSMMGCGNWYFIAKKSDAIAAAKKISVLADWNFNDPSLSPKDCGKQLKEILEPFMV